MAEKNKNPIGQDGLDVTALLFQPGLTPHIKTSESGEEVVIGYEGSFPYPKNGDKSDHSVDKPEVRELVRVQPVDGQSLQPVSQFEHVRIGKDGNEEVIGYSMRIPIAAEGEDERPGDRSQIFLYPNNRAAD